MKTRVLVDPLTRVEGHLRIETVVENGVVVEAHSSGTLYRGFEQILQGREPVDAVQLTQRFCGVCPIAHAIASSQCLDNAFGVIPPDNGRVIRNLIQGANYLQSHVLHFYQLAALDFARGPDFPPYIPRYEADYRLPQRINDELVQHYLQALQVRLKAHEMCAVFAGKMPHCATIVPGGVTVTPASDKITTFLWRLNELRAFVNDVYLPDVISVAKVYRDYAEIGTGCRNLLSFGVFDLDNEPDVRKRKRLFPMGRVQDGKLQPVDPSRITEDVKYSWYSSPSHLPPSAETTVPDPHKANAYSWIKAPRYDDQVYEVGPLARGIIAYHNEALPQYRKVMDEALSVLRLTPDSLYSVLGRHLCRVVEAKVLADAMADWVLQVRSEEPVAVAFKSPDSAVGFGLWDAPRGALGHWASIRDKHLDRYQAIVPTTWNASPHDDKNRPGAMEQALLGAPVRDPENPFALARIVRSFDPCLACAIHTFTPMGRRLTALRVI